MSPTCGQGGAQGLRSLVHGRGSLIVWVAEEVFRSVPVLGHFDAADTDGLQVARLL